MNENRLEQNISQHGEVLNINNSTPILLTDNAYIYWVVEGGIDIFAVEDKDNHLTQRRHLTRHLEKNLMFGFPVSSGVGSLNLIGVGLPNTKVIRMEANSFALTKEKFSFEVALHVERWLQAWGEFILQNSPSPKNFSVLPINDTVILKEAEITLNENTAVWVYNLNKKIKWCNINVKDEFVTQGFFCVPSNTWIQAQEKDTEFDTTDTNTFIVKSEFLSTLNVFHQTLLIYIKNYLEHYTVQEDHQLEAKTAAESDDLKREINHFVSVVGQRDDEGIQGETGNHLYDATRLVANQLQVTLPPFATLSHESDFLLESIKKQANLSIREVSLLEHQWWTKDNGPLLGFLKEDDTPVALIPKSGSGYELFNTKSGVKFPVNAEIAASLQNQAIMFFRKFKPTKIFLKDFIGFGLKNGYRDVFRLFMFGTLAGLFSIAVPYATGVLFNSIIPSNQQIQLFQIIAILVVVTGAIAFFQMASAIALLRLEGKVKISTQAAMIERLFSLPAPFFREFSAGDLAQRVFAADNIMQIVTGTTQIAILAGVFSLFSWAYLFFISVELALVATVLVGVALAIFIFLNYARLRYERLYSEIQGKLLNSLFQILKGIAKLRIAGAETKAFILWGETFRKNIVTTLKAQNIANYLLTFNAVFIIFSLIFIFGWIEMAGIKLHTGDFLAFYAAFIQFSTAILGMSSALTNSLNAIPLYERTRPILQTAPEVDENKINPGEILGNLEVSQVSFRYQKNAPLILHDVSFQVRPGEFLAIVGPSSSGKSTLLRLILGLEHPTSGAIYFDGKNINELDLQVLRRQIGVVIQNAKLFPGSVFSNIVGSSSATLDDAWEAARLAGFEADIKAMPMGMHTYIAEGLGTISGGQRQRILIARAIVNKPKMLLFDEASSALDNLTQAIVSESLATLRATRIVIAHRLSTILEADRILVLSEGRIVESGTYQELMTLNKKFAQLAKRQIVE